MNAVQTQLALEAAIRQQAVPKALVRHVHLAPEPLVIVGYHLAGDLGAPLAIMWGTDPHEAPNCIAIPEPRNRQLRFEELATFGHALSSYLSQFDPPTTAAGALTSVSGSDETPQLVVPNGTTAEWLFDIVGRFTRNLRGGQDSDPPWIVPTAGKHLSFFSDPLPGSCLVLRATDLLTTHWQTGQLPSEDMNLSALLAWIDPPAGVTGAQAAKWAETLPPAGPISDPNWDAEILTHLINSWHSAGSEEQRLRIKVELVEEVRGQLAHTWNECWAALSLVRALPEARSVAARQQRDRGAWLAHQTRMASGDARFRNVATPVQAAQRLRMLEDATAAFERDTALDDPLKMAGYIASGDALAGRVISVNPIRRSTATTNGRVVRRPLVRIATDLEFPKPLGTPLYFVRNPTVEARVINIGEGFVDLEVVGGAVTDSTAGRLPSAGEEVVFSPFGSATFFPRPSIGATPWTHVLPVVRPVEVE